MRVGEAAGARQRCTERRECHHIRNVHVTASLFGAAVAVRRESHFNFPTLVEMAPAPIRAFLKLLARLIALVFGAALGWYGGFLMIDSWNVPMAGAPLPEGLSYVGLCLGGGLIALFALERLISGDYPAEEHA